MQTSRRRALVVSVAAVASLAMAGLPSSLAAQSLPDSVARRIDAVFARYTASGPGCAAGVFQNGRITFAKGYGLANIEYSVPLTPKTPMIMGSVSKQFTAAAIALLVEQGRISLDDDVHKYVPELADYGKTITIGHLVHHTSGIRDFWSLVQAAGMRNDDGYTVGDVLTLASRQKNLNFDPGAEYNYSNTGYVLMGVIVQRVTGKTLRRFAADEIFGPLGMTSSHYHDDHNEPVRGRAFAYSPVRPATPNATANVSDAANTNATPLAAAWTINIWNNDIVGQGGVMTTVEDLQKWDENFYTGRVGGQKLLARQLERGVLNDGKVIPYAFGLNVTAYRGLPMVEHSGSTGGYRTDIARFPSLHTSVVTMCNVSSADAAGMALRVADAVMGARFTEPVPAARTTAAGARQQAAAVPLTDAERSAMAGTYHSDELDANYRVEMSGPSLVLHRPRTPAEPLRAVDRSTLRTGSSTLRFDAPVNAASPSFSLDVGRARGMVFTRVK